MHSARSKLADEACRPLVEQKFTLQRALRWASAAHQVRTWGVVPSPVARLTLVPLYLQLSCSLLVERRDGKCPGGDVMVGYAIGFGVQIKLMLTFYLCLQVLLDDRNNLGPRSTYRIACGTGQVKLVD